MTSEIQNQETLREFTKFCETIAMLRHPEDGCPWDIKQTHKTLRRYMIEEAYEASNAMGGDHHDSICDELGDVLLQVVLNAQIAADNGHFNITDVIKSIDNKMRRRHPHVFQKAEHSGKVDLDSLHRQWHKIKDQEKGNKSSSEDSVFAQKKVEKVHPATSQANKIGYIASDIRFDWSNSQEVFDVLKSEFLELEQAWNESDKNDRSHVLEEIGDVYFSLAQLCRHLKEDPEIIAQEGNNKFLRRFAGLESLAKKKGIQLFQASREQFLQLWKDVKNAEG
ncbi:MAG: nucleoside triphosphate pyrophosphohydrolase [Oligoflexales bacterium]